MVLDDSNPGGIAQVADDESLCVHNISCLVTCDGSLATAHSSDDIRNLPNPLGKIYNASIIFTAVEGEGGVRA
jgi:hypothetical protein